ncbi:YggS family pyridoxal phosphate-dependent enzyme [Marasmitruncus massiliensis]|uniref:YggS family pyridoxal phosphate-dependent enzyme n=1 Tax=Marasmitruncus massiliensis TaxID=1944642 RepID=UPI000C7B22BF|nr:YggS family pyridoxal phosphate-dependent enzyme [Marasmitruncus massiliensis]
MTVSRSDDNSIAHTVRCISDHIREACVSCGRNPADVRFMAVTKTVDAARVNEAIDAGITLLGENKAQELCAKYEDYHKSGVEIHFIGHLQTNKVRQIIDKVTMVQSLDSIPLAEELQRQCEKHQKHLDCLVEVNIGEEQTKSGILPELLPRFLEQMTNFDRIHVRGMMAIPPICEDIVQKEHYFSSMYQLFIDIGEKKIDNINMDFLSMGMSDDYSIAIKHGSNLVRIGSALFGRRNYPNKI